MKRVARIALTVALASTSVGTLHCGPLAAPSSDPFSPTRFDYSDFRRTRSGDEVREPNYLPFLGQRFALRDKQQDVVVLCRWDVTRFPLTVYVQPPDLDPALKDEFDASKEPNAFTEAAWRALESWEHSLGGVVSFRRVRSDEDADLRIVLVGQIGPAPEEGVQVLGTTPMHDACKVPYIGNSICAAVRSGKAWVRLSVATARWRLSRR